MKIEQSKHIVPYKYSAACIEYFFPILTFRSGNVQIYTLTWEYYFRGNFFFSFAFRRNKLSGRRTFRKMETLYKFTQCRKWCFQRFRCRKWILFCEYLLYRSLYNYVCIVCRYIAVMVQPGTLLQNALCSCSHKSSRYPTEKMSLQKSLKVGGNHPLHSSFCVILQGASLQFY